MRVEGLEPGFQLAVAVLGRHGLERVAIGRGLAEQVLGLTVAHAHAFGLNDSSSRPFTAASIPPVVRCWRRERCSSDSRAGVICHVLSVGVIARTVNSVQMAFTPTASSRVERSPEPSESPSSAFWKEQDRCVCCPRKSLRRPFLVGGQFP